jgi:hypothetical protein
LHVAVPAGSQTVKLGLTELGDAATLTFALPPVPLLSQTQIA